MPAILQLVRFPNLFTAAADIFAGYFVVHGSKIEEIELFLLSLSSMCLYAAGCVLNDLADRELDAEERPFRPIPSGRISLPAACVLLVVLLCAGLFFAYRVGMSALVIAAILTVLVVSYDTLTKNLDPYGPLNMAACRSFNLLLGMSTGLSWTGETVLFPLLTLVYVFSLTTLSRFEVSGKPGGERGWIAVGWGIVVMVLTGLWLGGRFHVSGMAWLACFVAWTGPPLWVAIRRPAPEMVGKAVKAMVLGLPLLDAVYAAGVQGWFFGLIVALFIVPACLLSRYVYVT